MKTAMSDQTTNNGGGIIGICLMVFGWISGFIGLTTLSILPIALSSLASIMACVNYYYQIKKNRK